MAIRAVTDTSALYIHRHRVDLQSLAQAGLFTAIWSPWIIAELNRVLSWRWFREVVPGDTSTASYERCSQAAKTMMVLLLPVFETVDPKPPYPAAWDNLSDEWDKPIWATAKAAGADYVVSQNTRDFPPRNADGRHIHDGIEYVMVDAFIGMFVDSDVSAEDVRGPFSWKSLFSDESGTDDSLSAS